MKNLYLILNINHSSSNSRRKMGNESSQVKKEIEDKFPSLNIQEEEMENMYEGEVWYKNTKFLEEKFGFSAIDFAGPMAFSSIFFLYIEEEKKKKVNFNQFLIYMNLRLLGILSEPRFITQADENVFLDMKKVDIMIRLLWKYKELRKPTEIYYKTKNQLIDKEIDELRLCKLICEVYKIIEYSFFDELFQETTSDNEESERKIETIEYLKKRQNCWIY